MACGPQHPFADLENAAAVFRDWDENDRRYLTANGMRPAQQGLESNDLAALDILLRLINKTKLLRSDCVAQIVFDAATIARFRAHCGLEKAICVAAFLLGAIERGVGVAE